MSTLAYALIIFLGWRMHRFVRENLHGASNTQRRTLEVQRQLTRTLIIQASVQLPKIIIEMNKNGTMTFADRTFADELI
jgi:hypothetical protein